VKRALKQSLQSSSAAAQGSLLYHALGQTLSFEYLSLAASLRFNP